MSKVRITKEFSFESAHSLLGYDGKCSHIHGHSYKMFVTVIGTQQFDPASPKDGMILDFKVLKEIVNRSIIDKFDHTLILMEGSPLSEPLNLSYGNVITLPFRPTSENMVSYFAEILNQELSTYQNTSLYSIRLHETATSFVEWFADDNI